MPWGGFVPPIVTPAGSPNPVTAPSPAPKKPTVIIKPAANPKLDSYIDKDLVESVIAERNWTELNWLYEVLGEVKIRIRNHKTGRYIKSDRYIDQILKIKESGEYSERTTPSGQLQEIQSDGFEDD